MGRRKLLLVIIVFGFMVLFVTPLAAPGPVSVDSPATAPEEASASDEPLPPPPLTAEPAKLRVAAVTDEAGIALLERQSSEVATLHPEIGVSWQRIDPLAADAAALKEQLDGVDVLLLPNEEVKPLAVGGALLPVDAAFLGDALSEQFGVLVSQMKWNGYLWGVPRDFDPYVTVWNRSVLAAANPDEPSAAPQNLAQWLEWPQRLADQGVAASWLALDRSDPYALLAWFGAATGRRQDEWFGAEESVWSGQPYEQALTLLAQQRGGIADAVPDRTFWTALAAGKYGAAVVRNSAATKGLAELPTAAAAELRVDRSAWETPFVWPGGDSFVLSAWTENEDAALTWIGEMTGRQRQRENEEETGRLPVYRSLYEGTGSELPALATARPQRFPNQAPLSVAPDLPERLASWASLLGDVLDGASDFAAWKERWAASLANAQAND